MAAAAGLSPCPARIEDVPTPPPLEVIEPHDDSPDEIESRAELDLHLAAGTLAGLAVQGLRLDTDPPDLSGVEVAGALFVGCRFTSREVEADLVRRGAHVVPAFVDLPYPTAAGPEPFTRADVVFTGVDHSTLSYDVRLFFNNPAATADTARTPDERYAGRFTVFGHGGCYGDEGHCDVPEPSTDPTDLRPPHPLTPLDTYVTVTDALRILLTDDVLRTTTLVPVSLAPRQSDRGPALELLHFADVSLQIYLTATEDDAPS